MPIILNIECCDKCPWMRTGTDGRTKVGERVLVVNKCGKKRGSNIIKDPKKIPRWCPFRFNSGTLEDTPTDYAFYNKEMEKDFLGLPLSITNEFSKGHKYRTKGGWVSLILLNSLKDETSKEFNIVALHAIPKQGLENTKISFSNNGYENAKKVYYILVLHYYLKAIKIVAPNNVDIVSLSKFDLSKIIKST